MDLEEIKAKVRNSDYDLSEHAHVERQSEHISVQEIQEAIASGEVIERYPKDQRGESVLIVGKFKGRSLHIVCGKRNDKILVVTVYEPKPPKWLSYKQRAREVKSRV